MPPTSQYTRFSCPSCSGLSLPGIFILSSEAHAHLRSGLAIGTLLPTQSVLPHYHVEFNPYLVFDLNGSAIYVLLSAIFYFLMEPTAAVCPYRLRVHLCIDN